MTYHHHLGALTAAQVAETDQTLTDLTARIMRQNNIIRQAQQAGFDRDLIDELTRKGNQLMERIEQLSVQVDGISSSQYDEWRQRLSSFGTDVRIFETTVQQRVGSSTSTRNWKIIGATAGALAVAGLIGAVVWYSSFYGDV